VPLFDPVHLGQHDLRCQRSDLPHQRSRDPVRHARVTEALTVQGSSSWNSSEQDRRTLSISNVPGNPTPIGQCITQIQRPAVHQPVLRAWHTAAVSPPWQFNVRARYDWEVVGTTPLRVSAQAMSAP